MASLAQEHEPALVQVLVIGAELVVYVKVRRPLVLLAAELARLVSAGEHVLAEDLPLWSSTESLVLFLYNVKVN